jgi:hypothetical protein
MIASPPPKHRFERAVTVDDWRVASALRYFVLASRGTRLCPAAEPQRLAASGRLGERSFALLLSSEILHGKRNRQHRQRSQAARQL